MSNKEYKASCALCGLAVEIDGFSLLSSEGEKKFCCAGCQSVYQLINPTTDKPFHNNNEDNNEDNKP
jgi:hypothetical protein